MKLATLKQGGRDGTLIVVSRDLERGVAVGDIASTLQVALDDWETAAPRLEQRYRALNEGEAAASFIFDQSACHCPLPRAFQWVDGSGYLNHVELVRRARGAAMPPDAWTDPIMYQGSSDDFTPPRDPVRLASEDWGIDLEAELAAITGDVPIGSSASQCGAQIRLLMLANDISLRGLIPAELAKGFGFFQSKPTTSFSPVAVTPEELGGLWRNQRLHAPVRIDLNGEWFGCPDAGADVTFTIADLMAHTAKTRRLGAGTIVGSGTISNRDRSTGHACIAERRCVETIDQGSPATPFFRFGDRVRIEAFDANGLSLFGAIDQRIEATP
jgi:fumarylacetoacetate (FAA) hydrolase